jgi:hypothetical protein
MTPTLPPERDLPPGRRAAIRDEIVAAVTPPRARRAYRWVAPVAVATAVAAVAGAGAATGLLPAGSPRDTPPGDGATPSASPVLPGVDAARAAQIVRDCLRSAGLERTPVSPSVSPGGTATEAPVPSGPPETPSPSPEGPPIPVSTPTPGSSEPAPQPTPSGTGRPPQPSQSLPAAPSESPSGAGHLLRNLLTDARGTAAFVLGDRSQVLCTARPGGAFTGSLGAVPTGSAGWLPGTLSIDQAAAGARETGATTGADGVRVTPDAELVQGRVGRTVTRVTVTGLNGATVTVTPRNGTFLARILHTPGQPVSGPDQLLVRAYDGSGQLLAERDAFGDQAGCYVTPDGHVIFGDPATDRSRCRPATRWP